MEVPPLGIKQLREVSYSLVRESADGGYTIIDSPVKKEAGRGPGTSSSGDLARKRRTAFHNSHRQPKMTREEIMEVEGRTSSGRVSCTHREAMPLIYTKNRTGIGEWIRSCQTTPYTVRQTRFPCRLSDGYSEFRRSAPHLS